ncbi:MAG: glutamate--tRNA ligase family protein, partial [Raoultibacter sp.]
MTVGRFAPSPTGRMHAGNIFAALMAWLLAKQDGGHIVLRIEDLDRERSRQEYSDALMHDFELLGLTWDRGPYFQSNRTDIYQEIAHDLESKGLLYPCFCSRADLHASSAPHVGEKTIYAGTCRNLTRDEIIQHCMTRKPAVRISVRNEVVTFDDMFQGTFTQNLMRDCGDFLIKRSDDTFAY